MKSKFGGADAAQYEGYMSLIFHRKYVRALCELYLISERQKVTGRAIVMKTVVLW